MIEKIKAEIKQLQETAAQRADLAYDGGYGQGYNHGQIDACEQMLDFIESTEKE